MSGDGDLVFRLALVGPTCVEVDKMDREDDAPEGGTTGAFA